MSNFPITNGCVVSLTRVLNGGCADMDSVVEWDGLLLACRDRLLSLFRAIGSRDFGRARLVAREKRTRQDAL